MKKHVHHICLRNEIWTQASDRLKQEQETNSHIAHDCINCQMNLSRTGSLSKFRECESIVLVSRRKQICDELQFWFLNYFQTAPLKVYIYLQIKQSVHYALEWHWGTWRGYCTFWAYTRSSELNLDKSKKW